MHKTAAALVALFLIAVLVGGCGRPEGTVYVSKGGKVTATKTGPNAGRVEIETKEGKATIETNTTQTVTEAELGVPVYAGAVVKQSGTIESNSEKVFTCSLATTDDFEKVVAFYKSNLSNAQNTVTSNTGEAKVASFVVGSTEASISLTIMWTKKEPTTMIQVVRKLK